MLFIMIKKKEEIAIMIMRLAKINILGINIFAMRINFTRITVSLSQASLSISTLHHKMNSKLVGATITKEHNPRARYELNKNIFVD